jgi:hypothetical protein
MSNTFGDTFRTTQRKVYPKKKVMDTNDINMEEQKPPEYGWFSEKQIAHVNDGIRRNDEGKRPKYNIYLTDNGKEVPVTMVLYTDRREDVNFDDAVLQGRVVKWVRGVFQ